MRRKLSRLIRRQKQRAAVSLFAALFLVLGCVLLSRYIVTPAQGMIETVNTALFVHGSFDMAPATVSSNYAMFSYPKGLSNIAVQSAHPPVLQAYNWAHNDIQTWRLAVAIIDVPSGLMNDNNAYLFRKRNPQRFSESEQVVNGQTVPVMTDTAASGFSKVCFLRHGRYQATISLYGDDQRGTQDLQTTLSMVLSSWHWLEG